MWLVAGALRRFARVLYGLACRVDARLAVPLDQPGFAVRRRDR